MNLGDRFGEEAFFGHWGRSIDLSIKLKILRQVSRATQQELVARHGCVMPTIQEYVALYVLTSKVFQKWLYHGRGLWEFAHSSTYFTGGPLLIAISRSRGHLQVDSNHYLPEFVGAGGRRKFSH